MSPRAPDSQAVAALQDALAAEHAALWSYALADAFLEADQAAAARTDAAAHRELRAAVEIVLVQAGQRPVPAQPAYATPQPVLDAVSAAGLLVTAEADAAAAWRSLLERSADPRLRRTGFDALVATTARSTRWRGAAGTVPAVPVFPGRP